MNTFFPYAFANPFSSPMGFSNPYNSNPFNSNPFNTNPFFSNNNPFFSNNNPFFGNPFNSFPGSSPFNTPFNTPFNSSPFNTPFNATPFSTPFNTPFNTPFSTPYNSPFASPFAGFGPFPTPGYIPAPLNAIGGSPLNNQNIPNQTPNAQFGMYPVYPFAAQNPFGVPGAFCNDPANASKAA